MQDIIIENPLEVLELKKLKELENTLDIALNKHEFLKIVSVYNECISRLLNESEGK